MFSFHLRKHSLL